jgi:hypothetical protein
MRKIILTALGTALIALSVASAATATAAQRHHVRRTSPQPTYNSNADVRDSYAQFGPAYRGDDARAWGGAISAPAGR